MNIESTVNGAQPKQNNTDDQFVCAIEVIPQGQDVAQVITSGNDTEAEDNSDADTMNSNDILFENSAEKSKTPA